MSQVVGDFIGAFLLLTFLVFVSTSTVLFQFFKCDYFSDIDKYFMAKDYSTSQTPSAKFYHAIPFDDRQFSRGAEK